jgi:lipooligosaccharide transport system permease protein
LQDVSVCTAHHAIDWRGRVGNMPDNILLHVAGLLAYGSAGYVIALALTRRRLLK